MSLQQSTVMNRKSMKHCFRTGLIVSDCERSGRVGSWIEDHSCFVQDYGVRIVGVALGVTINHPNAAYETNSFGQLVDRFK